MANPAQGDPPVLTSVAGSLPPEGVPTRESKIGARLYDVGRPLVGDDKADLLRAMANLLDDGPELARELGAILSRSSADTTTDGAIPVTDRPRQTEAPTTPARWPIAILASFAFAVIVVGAGALVLAVRDLRTSAHASDVRAAAHEAEDDIRREHDATQAAESQRQIDDLATRMATEEHRTKLLTTTMFSQLGAIGKQTGADQLPEWGEIPTDLMLVILQVKAEEEAAKRDAR